MTQSLWHRARKAQFPKPYLWALSHFLVEGDSFLLPVCTVGIMLPLSEVKRPLETRGHQDQGVLLIGTLRRARLFALAARAVLRW